MNLCCDLLRDLSGKTLATAESLTAGWIGATLASVPGCSAVYKGGVISYCNEIKHKLLGVSQEVLDQFGPVCAPVAEQMAVGARKALCTDIAVSVTGLAGPGGDEYGNPQGTVFIGYADEQTVLSQKFLFAGDRDEVRRQTVEAAVRLVLEQNR